MLFRRKAVESSHKEHGSVAKDYKNSTVHILEENFQPVKTVFLNHLHVKTDVESEHLLCRFSHGKKLGSLHVRYVLSTWYLCSAQCAVGQLCISEL